MAVSCRFWVCTSPGHWSRAKDVFVAHTAGHWSPAKNIWWRHTTVWTESCVGGAMGLGYLYGGSDNKSNADLDIVDELHLVTETLSQLTVRIHNKWHFPCSFASEKKAFGSYYFNVDFVLFATKTTGRASNLPDWQYDAAGLSDILLKGFSLGGRTTHDKMLTRIFFTLFANDTSGSTGKFLQSHRERMGSVGNLIVGYCYGGHGARGGMSNMDKFLYKTATPYRYGKHLAKGVAAPVAIGNLTTAYIVGGNVGNTYQTDIYKHVFATDALTTSARRLTEPRGRSRGLGAGTKGLLCGGKMTTDSIVHSIERLTFATEVAVRSHESLHFSRYFAGGATTRGTAL